MASRAVVRSALVGAGVSALCLALLQTLLAERLERAQISQMGPEVAFNLRLAELALDRLPPAALARLSGLPLLVAERPPTPLSGVAAASGRLQRQAARLQADLCQRLEPCPPVLPAAVEVPALWVQVLSPLEPVWLLTPLAPQRHWPPDPLLLGVSLLAGSISASLLFLWRDVQRPLQRLERALAAVDLGQPAPPAPLALQGAPAVQRLTGHLNAMVQRLAESERARATMLAGIAHDLKSPITRLRLRLGLAQPDGADRQRAEADLDALERITGQFLLFAGGGDGEAPVLLPLEQWLAELTAALDPEVLELDLQPLEARIQPVALGRAVSNVIENALSHGRPPLRLVLRPDGLAGAGVGGFRIEVWDRGDGIPEAAWPQALQPFQRLDRARGGSGHCGLGLAIAARVAAAHGGALTSARCAGDAGFAVVLQGRSLPAPQPPVAFGHG
jgi:two-component system osmolarity sensor histidine kinase EnvZ